MTEDQLNMLIKGLCAQQRLVRERELIKLKGLLGDETVTGPLLSHVMADLSNQEAKWETTAGLVGAAIQLLPICDSTQVDQLYAHAKKKLLDHSESRVRKESGELLAQCVATKGESETLKVAYSEVVALIRRDLERDPGQAELPENEKVRQKIIEGQSQRGGKSSEQIFHESAGWRHLETSMAALKRLFEVNPQSGLLSQALFDLVKDCAAHSNRFIRENSFYILGAVMDETLDSSSELVSSFAELIFTGLSDNWSQVRMASSASCRAFLFALNEKKRESFFSLLLPPIALNRYYIAAGVRIHNQETWKKLFPQGGASYVDESISSFVDFYCKQIVADNHAVREAACACIAELAQKCSADALSKEWSRMLTALVDCFGDDSWPVRDATCIAAGAFIRVLPEITKPMHEVLFAKFLANCTDPIASVRQGGAAALAALVTASKDEFLEKGCSPLGPFFVDLVPI